MLRASVQATAVPLEPRAITDPSRDPLLPAGGELIRFVDAALGGDGDSAREALRTAVGDEGLVDAAGVLGNFEMMNRIADATGMPVGKGTLRHTAEWRELLGIDRYRHI